MDANLITGINGYYRKMGNEVPKMLEDLVRKIQSDSRKIEPCYA